MRFRFQRLSKRSSKVIDGSSVTGSAPRGRWPGGGGRSVALSLPVPPGAPIRLAALVWLMLTMLLLPLPGSGAFDAYQFDDPQQEARFKQLIAELRCLVCQNQNLADSNAELAQDMRRLTYEMVRRGESNEQIVAFMVQRYGDFVMYRPPFKNSTVMLWVGPFLILAAAVLILIVFIRRRARAEVEPLAAEAHERARRLLDDQQT